MDRKGELLIVFAHLLPGMAFKPLLIIDRSLPNVDAEYILRAIDLLLGFLHLANVKVHNFVGDSGAENFAAYSTRHHQIVFIRLLTILLAVVRDILANSSSFQPNDGETLVIKEIETISNAYLSKLGSPSSYCNVALENCINNLIGNSTHDENSVWTAFLHWLQKFNKILHTPGMVDDDVRSSLANLVSVLSHIKIENLRSLVSLKFNVISASSLSKRIPFSFSLNLTFEMEKLLQHFVVDKEAFHQYCKTLCNACAFIKSSRSYPPTNRTPISQLPIIFLQSKPTRTIMTKVLKSQIARAEGCFFCEDSPEKIHQHLILNLFAKYVDV